MFTQNSLENPEGQVHEPARCPNANSAKRIDCVIRPRIKRGIVSAGKRLRKAKYLGNRCPDSSKKYGQENIWAGIIHPTVLKMGKAQLMTEHCPMISKEMSEVIKNKNRSEYEVWRDSDRQYQKKKKDMTRHESGLASLPQTHLKGEYQSAGSAV